MKSVHVPLTLLIVLVIIVSGCTSTQTTTSEQNQSTETSNSKCIPNWQCGDWTRCLFSTQNRACVDMNECGTLEGMPSYSQPCQPDSADSIFYVTELNQTELCGSIKATLLKAGYSFSRFHEGSSLWLIFRDSSRTIYLTDIINSTSVEIEVERETQTIDKGSSKRIGGLDVYVREITYLGVNSSSNNAIVSFSPSGTGILFAAFRIENIGNEDLIFTFRDSGVILDKKEYRISSESQIDDMYIDNSNYVQVKQGTVHNGFLGFEKIPLSSYITRLDIGSSWESGLNLCTFSSINIPFKYV